MGLLLTINLRCWPETRKGQWLACCGLPSVWRVGGLCSELHLCRDARGQCVVHHEQLTHRTRLILALCLRGFTARYSRLDFI